MIFGHTPPPRGYTWWYIDVLSDDGEQALTLIAFVGGVFSPWYHAARAGGAPANPLDFCGINVCLYGMGPFGFAYEERPATHRDDDAFVLGENGIRATEDGVEAWFDVLASPVGRRLKGKVTLRFQGAPAPVVHLDPEGRHRWQVRAPAARAEVEVGDQRFSGVGYHDWNHGDEPLEERFRRWSWQRVALPQGAAVFYDVELREGARRDWSWRSDTGQAVEAPEAELYPGFFLLGGHARGEAVRRREWLEDSPFYTRSELDLRMEGHAARAVHEHLDLDRFVHPATQWMLPWRMRKVEPTLSP